MLWCQTYTLRGLLLSVRLDRAPLIAKSQMRSMHLCSSGLVIAIPEMVAFAHSLYWWSVRQEKGQDSLQRVGLNPSPKEAVFLHHPTPAYSATLKSSSEPLTINGQIFATLEYILSCSRILPWYIEEITDMC